mgnify:CR=1 FL=1
MEIYNSFVGFEKSQIKTERGGRTVYDVKGYYKYLTLSELFEYFMNQRNK